MQHSIWKLAAVVGVSGLGFLVILQVQKGLHDAGMVQAAELDAAKEPAPETPASAKPAPAKAAAAQTVRARAADNPFAVVEAGGLDFRDDVPDASGLHQADADDVKLVPVPQTTDASPAVADDPFATIRTADSTDSAPSAVQPAGHATTAKIRVVESPVNVETPSGIQLAQANGDVSDFGPDPFAGLDAMLPNDEAAGLEERPAPVGSTSPSDLLDAADPFAETPAIVEEPPADEPAAAAPGSDPSDPFGALPEISAPPAGDAAAPLDDPFGSDPIAPAAGTEQERAEPAPADFGDDPFGDVPLADPAPAPAAEPMPAMNPTPGDAPAFPPLGDAPPLTPPAADQPPAESPADDPFGLGETPAQPAPDDEPPSQVPAGPMMDAPFGDPAPTTPDATPSFPPQDSPRLLPTENGTIPPGTGTGTVTDATPRGPQKAELTVEKKAPGKAFLGQPLVYEIHVTNVGDSTAHEVTVSDVVPKGAELKGTIPRAEMKDDRLVWRLDTLAPRESKAIKIKVVPIEAGQIGSVATVNFVSEVAAETKVVAPHLTLRVIAPPEVTLGQPVDIRFEIANEGTAPAERVMLRDLLPAGFRHADGNDLEYEVGTLPPGATEAVTLRVASVKAGHFTNKAVVTAAGGLKTEAAADVAVSSGQVSVMRRGPKNRYVGRPATYHNVVRNGSDHPAQGVQVIEDVPTGMEFVSASHGGQFDPNRRIIAWRLDALAPGDEQTLQVVLTAAAEGVQDSTVRVETTGGNPIELTSSTAVAGAPKLSPTLQGLDGPIAVGERAAFRIRVRNRGNAAADGVTVALEMPSQIKLIDARGAAVQSDSSGRSVVQIDVPVAANDEYVVDFVIEGVAPGNTTFRAEVNAAYLPTPLVKDQPVVIVAPTR